MEKTNNISPYKVYWVEFRAEKGIVTKKDAKILSTMAKFHNGSNRCNLMEHFPSKESAEKYLADKAENFKKKLSKSYEVRLCTDKQFSLGYVDYNKNIIVIPFTKKQNDAMYLIGKTKE